MSGSGSSDGTYGSGGPGTTDCANLFEQTTLNSPDPAVLATLQSGDVLDLIVQPPGRLVAVTSNGDIAGSVTSAAMAQLIACIQSGVAFIALVVSIQGGACDVELRPR